MHHRKTRPFPPALRQNPGKPGLHFARGGILPVIHLILRWTALSLLCLLLPACMLTLEGLPTPVHIYLSPVSTSTPGPATAAPNAAGTPENYVPMALPEGLHDELPVMSGICFESAYDAAGRVFVIRTALEHIRFYDAADHARLCRQPVTRYPFDFTTGHVLAGLWSSGTGCTARHDLLAYERDDTTRTITLRVKFITAGNCPYELVRPFWVSIPDAADYEITIVVE